MYVLLLLGVLKMGIAESASQLISLIESVMGRDDFKSKYKHLLHLDREDLKSVVMSFLGKHKVHMSNMEYNYDSVYTPSLPGSSGGSIAYTVVVSAWKDLRMSFSVIFKDMGGVLSVDLVYDFSYLDVKRTSGIISMYKGDVPVLNKLSIGHVFNDRKLESDVSVFYDRASKKKSTVFDIDYLYQADDIVEYVFNVGLDELLTLLKSNAAIKKVELKGSVIRNIYINLVGEGVGGVVKVIDSDSTDDKTTVYVTTNHANNPLVRNLFDKDFKSITLDRNEFRVGNN